MKKEKKERKKERKKESKRSWREREKDVGERQGVALYECLAGERVSLINCNYV